MTLEAEAQAPLFDLRGLAIAAIVSLCVCWPMMLHGTVYVSSDTTSYFKAGREIWDLALRALNSVSDGAAMASKGGFTQTSTAAQNIVFDNEPRFGRSIFYSAFAYPILSTVGSFGLAWAQGTLMLFALFALVTPQMLAARRVLIGGLALVILATQLPWRVVYQMPDIFAAIIVIFGATLVGPFDHMTRAQQIALTLLAGFSVATHYGNIPFAAGFFGLLLGWRLVTSRLAMAPLLAGVIAVAASPLANLGASVAVLDTASAVPLRLPIVLARSIQDGPGAEYLHDNCGTENWAICEAFGDRVPESIREFLWSEDGIRSQNPEMVQRIRNEEVALLSRIFLAHPVAQTWSLVGNSVKQIVRVGQGQMTPVDDLDVYMAGTQTAQEDGDALLRAFDPVVKGTTLVSAVLLAALILLRKSTSAENRVIASVVLGLACNAMVFGGLSAPVDRYQARVVWLIPACLGLLSAAVFARHRQAGRMAYEARDVL